MMVVPKLQWGDLLCGESVEMVRDYNAAIPNMK